jgi:hypothetical protein
MIYINLKFFISLLISKILLLWKLWSSEPYADLNNWRKGNVGSLICWQIKVCSRQRFPRTADNVPMYGNQLLMVENTKRTKNMQKNPKLCKNVILFFFYKIRGQ